MEIGWLNINQEKKVFWRKKIFVGGGGRGGNVGVGDRNYKGTWFLWRLLASRKFSAECHFKTWSFGQPGQ